MAGELAYVSGLTGERFDVSDYATVDFEGALELRGREWDYTVRNGGLTGVSRKRREISVDVHYGDAAAFDSFMRTVDADLAVGKPGRLEAVNGAGEVWTQSCYAVKSEASSHPDSSDPVCALSFVLLDGVWCHDAVTVSYHLCPSLLCLAWICRLTWVMIWLFRVSHAWCLIVCVFRCRFVWSYMGLCRIRR